MITYGVRTTYTATVNCSGAVVEVYSGSSDMAAEKYDSLNEMIINIMNDINLTSVRDFVAIFNRLSENGHGISEDDELFYCDIQ
jgi:hypothetical protein